ncbi:hypothetical protein ES332_A02G096100v1 [Gossypium tomentosum]|uniref:Uncharacterized protein n=1 Tax=Gossypium tomentosum TaxID=34277 RepID=A0A5D2RI03_GOSTO|nr:hypothetical protein ES332_A02G096100v1 [Gossypium tomentosum]
MKWRWCRICHRSSGSARIPTFHVSGLGPWQAVIAYDACCLHAWARGCMEAPMFLENECALLRDTFGLQQILLQSEEERMEKPTLDFTSEAAAPKPTKFVGKMKVQVHKVKTTVDPPTGCSMTSLSLSAPRAKLKTIQNQLSNFSQYFLQGGRLLKIFELLLIYQIVLSHIKV